MEKLLVEKMDFNNLLKVLVRAMLNIDKIMLHRSLRGPREHWYYNHQQTNNDATNWIRIVKRCLAETKENVILVEILHETVQKQIKSKMYLEDKFILKIHYTFFRILISLKHTQYFRTSVPRLYTICSIYWYLGTFYSSLTEVKGKTILKIARKHHVNTTMFCYLTKWFIYK